MGRREGKSTLKAILSRKWLTPEVTGDSYREPASMYKPTEEKWPGVDSVATRILLGRVVTCTGGCCGWVYAVEYRREPWARRAREDVALRIVVVADGKK